MCLADFLNGAFRKSFVAGEEIGQSPTIDVVGRSRSSVVSRPQHFEAGEWIVFADEHSRVSA